MEYRIGDLVVPIEDNNKFYSKFKLERGKQYEVLWINWLGDFDFLDETLTIKCNDGIRRKLSSVYFRKVKSVSDSAPTECGLASKL